MSSKRRITELAGELSYKKRDIEEEQRKPGEESPSVMKAIKPHGERGEYLRRTVILPPEIIEAVEMLSVKRKMQKVKNRTFSAITAEALANLLEKEKRAKKRKKDKT